MTASNSGDDPPNVTVAAVRCPHCGRLLQLDFSLQAGREPDPGDSRGVPKRIFGFYLFEDTLDDPGVE